ncbi:hypothetical protein J437_LFUL012665 [Ladona fulva]|uniref:Uncharacterized protein n=1 Tax=Ladona fulva TaxID=123851 RepID=A0A8K0KD08_LADFU|nr:hypothetical protein J437_LFUL012665 [Ladona fulva]
MGRCLVHSQPSIMYQNILPALFHYNNYQGHEMYKVYRVEGEGVSEKDSFGEEERRNIFRFMLQHLNDDQRQKIIGKICCEVLGGVVDGKVSLEKEEGCHLLSDAIWVLLCDEIRPAGLKSGEEEGDEAEGIDELADISAPPAETTEPGPPNKRKKNQFPGEDSKIS